MPGRETAVVIDCNKNGVGVIRSLHAAGYRVIGVDHTRLSPGLHSRRIAAACRVPRPDEDEGGFIEAMIDVATRHREAGKLHLVPVNDEYVLAFVKHWERLAPHYHAVFEIDPQVMRDCLEKTRMYRLATRAGVPIPKTVYSPLVDAEVEALRFPLIVKPYNKKAPECVRAGVFRLKVCPDRATLAETARYLDDLGVAFVAQEYLAGGDDQLYTAGIAAWRGEIAACFTGRKLRQCPPGTGTCSYGEALREPRIVEYSERFVTEARYTGMAQLEYKKVGDEFYLMEINPRIWQWNLLSTYCGVNLPRIACAAARHGRIRDDDRALEHQHDFESAWCFLVPDLYYNAISNRNVGLLRALGQAWRSQCYAFWERTDPLPATVALAYFAHEVLTGRKAL